MQYKIVRCEGFRMAEASIQEAIRDGWEPIGGVSIAPAKLRIKINCGDDEIISYMISQAMVKK